MVGEVNRSGLQLGSTMKDLYYIHSPNHIAGKAASQPRRPVYYLPGHGLQRSGSDHVHRYDYCRRVVLEFWRGGRCRRNVPDRSPVKRPVAFGGKLSYPPAGKYCPLCGDYYERPQFAGRYFTYCFGRRLVSIVWRAGLFA